MLSPSDTASGASESLSQHIRSVLDEVENEKVPDVDTRRDSNRFTVTDYTYDQDEGNAEAGPSTLPLSTYTVAARSGPTLVLPVVAAPSFALAPETRPSSWQVSTEDRLAQVRGSVQPPAIPADKMEHISPSACSNKPDDSPLVYPPSVATTWTSRKATVEQTHHQYPPVPRLHTVPPNRQQQQQQHPSSSSPSNAWSPGPGISPSDNVAIKRLPPLPTTPSGQIPRSPASPPLHPHPTLDASLSSTSIASSHPSLLPPFQLKAFGSRPSLATLPSGRSDGQPGGQGMEGRDGTELATLPSLTWEEYDDPDRYKTITWAGLDEGKVGDAEKGLSKPQGHTMSGGRRRQKGGWLTWIIPESMYCKLLLATVVVELMIDLIIEGNILWRFNTEVNSSDPTPNMLENKRRLPIFLIIFGLAHLWQLILTIIAIRTKNTIQISAITIFNFAFLAWAIIQVYELREILGDLQTSLIDGSTSTTSTNLLNLPLNVLTAVIIGVVAACSLLLSVLAYFVRREFGWQRYRFLGADLQIRGYYRRFQILECLIYFSAFFAAGFGIQFLWLVLQKTDAEYIITWVMFPLSLILLVIGRTAAKYENKPFMAYFIFKLVRIWQQSNTVYLNVSKSLTVFDALSILSLTATLVWSILVYRDFGKGLKGAVLSQGPKSPRVGSNRWRSEGGEVAAAAAEKRLSID